MKMAVADNDVMSLINCTIIFWHFDQQSEEASHQGCSIVNAHPPLLGGWCGDSRGDDEALVHTGGGSNHGDLAWLQRPAAAPYVLPVSYLVSGVDPRKKRESLEIN